MASHKPIPFFDGKAAERFWSKVERHKDGCWPWLGYVMPNGYGKVGLPRSRKVVLAHRRAFELAHGRAPDGVVMHSCDNRCCVNPAHLVEGTQGDNLRDMTAKGRHWQTQKTHCSNGHEFTAVNTYEYIGRNGHRQRQCRTCAWFHS
jgi:hypothetical protein